MASQLGLVLALLSIYGHNLQSSAMPFFQPKYISGFMGAFHHGHLHHHFKKQNENKDKNFPAESQNHPAILDKTTLAEDYLNPLESTIDPPEGVSMRTTETYEQLEEDKKVLKAVEEENKLEKKAERDSVNFGASQFRHRESNGETYYPVNCGVSKDRIMEHCMLAQITTDQFKNAFESYCKLQNELVNPGRKTTCEDQAMDIISSHPPGYLPEISDTVGKKDNVQDDAQELLRGLHSYRHVATNISLQHENSICRLHREVGFECSADIVCGGQHANQTEVVVFCALYPFLKRGILDMENFTNQHKRLMTDHGVPPEYDESMDVNPVACEEYDSGCRDILRPYTMAGLYGAYQQMLITTKTYTAFYQSLKNHC